MPVRLLQLSDIHFGGENVEALEAALTYCQTTQFDLLVLCGDITQFGHAGEFDAAARWLSRLPQPWLSTPGNHDTPWLGLLERVMRPFEGYAKAVGPVSDDYASPGLAVAAINSARGWQVRLNWSKGEVSDRQGQEASRRLGAAGPDALRVLVCHHPLVEAEGEPITARVRGGAAAARRMTEAKVDLVLTGHLHVPVVQALPFGDRRTYAVGAGTLSLRERGVPPSFNLIEVADDALAVTALAWESRQLREHRRWTMPLRSRSANTSAGV
jgi:3',5'-cyclic AMP phosphodiesterase CpdA